jgi:hypothetical protein
MTVTYDVDIANLALQRLGQPLITTLADPGRDATICNELFNSNRDYCLIAWDWNELIQRQTMQKAGKVAVAGISQSDPAVITCTGHVFIANELVYIESLAGMTQLNEGTYQVYAYTSTTISLHNLDNSSVDSTAYTAWTSGGYVYRAPGSDWVFVYDLPTDCMKVLRVMDEDGGTDDDYSWKRERTHLYTNIENAGVEYIKEVTDPSLYQADLVELITARLAWLVSMRINSDKMLRQQIYQEFNAALLRAKITNAQDATGSVEYEDLWVDVR